MINDALEVLRTVMYAPLHGEGWVLTLAVIRALSIFTLLLKAKDILANRWRSPRAATVTAAGAYLLVIMQAVGALCAGLPGVPAPTPWIIISNLALVVMTVGVYLWRTGRSRAQER